MLQPALATELGHSCAGAGGAVEKCGAVNLVQRSGRVWCGGCGVVWRGVGGAGSAGGGCGTVDTEQCGVGGAGGRCATEDTEQCGAVGAVQGVRTSSSVSGSQ